MPDWLEVVWRTLVAVVIIFVITKILGKRQVSQLSLFEYITGITLGSLVAYISLDVQSDWYLGLIAMFVWAAVSFGVEFLQIKSKKARDFLDGKSTVLIKNGKVMEDNLKKEKLTIDELMEKLRNNNAFKVADVEFAVMEPSGDVNILLTKENQPITPKHLGVKVAPEREPQTVIMDGKMLEEPLATQGFNRQWLDTELEKLGVTMENVFIGQVDSYGQLFVDLYDDKIQVPQPQQKASLLATLKKCEADLEMYSLSTKAKKAKEMYGECSKDLMNVIDEIKPLLIS